MLSDIPGILAASLGSCVNNSPFPGLSREGSPTREASGAGPCMVSGFPAYTGRCPPSGGSVGALLSKHGVSGPKQALPHAGKHKHIPRQRPFLLRGGASARVRGQEEDPEQTEAVIAARLGFTAQVSGRICCSTSKINGRGGGGGSDFKVSFQLRPEKESPAGILRTRKALRRLPFLGELSSSV